MNITNKTTVTELNEFINAGFTDLSSLTDESVSFPNAYYGANGGYTIVLLGRSGKHVLFGIYKGHDPVLYTICEVTADKKLKVLVKDVKIVEPMTVAVNTLIGMVFLRMTLMTTENSQYKKFGPNDKNLDENIEDVNCAIGSMLKFIMDTVGHTNETTERKLYPSTPKK